MITNNDHDLLHAMVDRHGLAAVIDALAYICSSNADDSDVTLTCDAWDACAGQLLGASISKNVKSVSIKTR